MLHVDAVGFRVTTSGATSGCNAPATFDPLTGLSTVPLTHGFDPTQLQFVSASIDPTGVDAGTGLVSWSSIGQLSAGQTKTVTVTYRVLEPAGNATATTTTTATSTGAAFGSGDGANADAAATTITVEPAGSAEGYVYSDLNGNGWQGTTGYEAGTDGFLAGARVEIYRCTAFDNKGKCSTETLEQTVVTDATGKYVALGLAQGEHYRIGLDAASLPGTVAQTADADVYTATGGGSGVCSGNKALACDATWSIDNAFFQIGTDTWNGQQWDFTDISFGYGVNPAVSGAITWDFNGDGLTDAQDGGLAGVTVELQHAGCTAGVDCPTAVTDADGNYAFADLTAGTVYTVVATAFPTGDAYANTAQSDGTPDNNSTVTAQAGTLTSGLTSAFAASGTATASGDLYYDHREDGARATTDEPIASVTVRLYADADGNGVYDAATDALVATAVTDGTGAYAFANLPDGDYVVVPDAAGLPAGALQTGDADEAGQCITCDGQAAVVIAAGTSAAADFGYKPVGSATISATVFNDKDGPGTQLAGVEAGLADVEVYLYADYDGDGNYEAVDTTTTDADGGYAFAKLANGAFRVVVASTDADLPVDGAGNAFAATNATGVDVTIAAGPPGTQPAFGFGQLGSIGDVVFYDANANGAFDESESGAAGVTVYLCGGDADPCGALGAQQTAVTADGTGVLPKGAYRFTGLQPGTYTVSVEAATGPLAGTAITADPNSDGLACDDPQRSSLGYPACDGRYAVTVTYGTTVTAADFGYQPAGVIGDAIWLDADADGVIDAGEPRIAGVEVQLSVSATGTAVVVDSVTYNPGDLIATVYTDGDGAFGYSNLPDGEYVVTAVTPADRSVTYDADGTADGTYAVTIASGATSITGGACGTDCGLAGDIGYKLNGTASVSGTLCLEDAAGNGNGSCEGGEAIVEGTTVRIYDAAGKLVGETATDAAGAYAFTGLPAADYTVSVAIGANPLDMTAPTTAGVTEGPSGASAYRTVSVAGATTADFAFAYDVAFDPGDLPTTYNVVTMDEGGAYHTQPTSPTLFLGTAHGTSATATQTAEADGDANDDGVDFGNVGDWSVGTTDGASLTATASETGYLVAWFDFNKDGDFADAGEQAIGQVVTVGANAISFDVPAGTDLTGDTYVRVRLFESAPSFERFAYAGGADGGEVEDYRISSAPVPVTVYGFSAADAGDCALRFEWSVGTEIDVRVYVLEASTDGVAFAPVGEVSAAGHSAYATTAAPGDARYFRLRAVDLDGSSAVSAVIAADTDCAAATSLRAYPNPASANASLQVEVTPAAASRTLHLVDVYGRTVAQLSVDAGAARVELSLGGVAAGTYLLTDARGAGAVRVVVTE